MLVHLRKHELRSRATFDGHFVGVFFELDLARTRLPHLGFFRTVSDGRTSEVGRHKSLHRPRAAHLTSTPGSVGQAPPPAASQSESGAALGTCQAVPSAARGSGGGSSSARPSRSARSAQSLGCFFEIYDSRR